jgi:hypothetical protein
MALKDQLMGIEQGIVDVLEALVVELDRNYSEMSEANKTQYNTFFTQASDTGAMLA